MNPAPVYGLIVATGYSICPRRIYFDQKFPTREAALAKAREQYPKGRPEVYRIHP